MWRIYREIETIFNINRARKYGEQNMTVTIYEQKIYSCEVDSIDVYFEYGNSVVFCTGEKILAERE